MLAGSAMRSDAANALMSRLNGRAPAYQIPNCIGAVAGVKPGPNGGRSKTECTGS